MNKKKIIKIGIPVAAGCIVLALGIGFAVKNSGKAVKVAPVSSVNSGGWYDDSGIASYGTVTTNQKQDIYVDDTMPITQVYVKAGDTVKVGDRLVAYDTTLSSLELEMKEMQIQGIDLNIQNLQKDHPAQGDKDREGRYRGIRRADKRRWRTTANCTEDECCKDNRS